MIYVHFQGKQFNITVIQVYAKVYKVIQSLMWKKRKLKGSIMTYKAF